MAVARFMRLRVFVAIVFHGLASVSGSSASGRDVVPMGSFQVFALIVALLAVSLQATADPFPQGPHVYVQGNAEVEAPSATASIEASYDHEDSDVERGVGVVTAAVARVVAGLVAVGVAADDINVSEASVLPARDRGDGARAEDLSLVKRRVLVTLRDLSRYPEVIRVINAGNPSTAGHLEVHSADDRALVLQAQAGALADARARADLLARASGMVVTTTHSISEFDERMSERAWLYPDRRILQPEGQGSGELPAPMVVLGPEGYVLTLAPRTVRATASVYVIFLMEPATR